jgi:hypothetical protein
MGTWHGGEWQMESGQLRCGEMRCIGRRGVGETNLFTQKAQEVQHLQAQARTVALVRFARKQDWHNVVLFHALVG